MICIVTKKRLARLEADTHAAFERARETSEAANKAADRHADTLSAATGRAERAEARTADVDQMFTAAVAELAAAQEQLLQKDGELRRLREQLEGKSLEGRWVAVLLHYGAPHAIYASYEEAKADVATHGVNGTWGPGDERPPAEYQWRIEPFMYDADRNGFRRVYVPAQRRLGEAA